MTPGLLWLLWLPSSGAASDALDVLVLDDGGAESADLVSLLGSVGHTVTLSSDDGQLESDFDGAVYDLADHAVVIWLDGDLSRDEDMPAAGQQALVAWVESGGGLLHTAATSARYEDDGENADAVDLMLLEGSELTIGTADFEVFDGTHPATGTYKTGDTFQILGLGMVPSSAGLGTTLIEWAPGSSPEGPYEALVVDDLGDGRVAQLGWLGHVGAGWSSNLDYTNSSVTRLLPDVLQWLALRPPAVDAGGPYSAEPGDLVLVSGTAEDPDGGEVICAWDLDEDGGADTSDLLTSWDTSMVDGPLEVSLLLSCVDDEGEAAEDTAELSVSNVPPTILEIAVPSPAEEGTELTLSVTWEDPEPDDTHTVLWDLGDGTEGTGDTVTHTYAADGQYTVAVTVTDDDGDSDSRSFAWTIHNQAPTVILEGEQALEVGEEALFRCTATDPGGDPVALSWDFGDGVTAGDEAEVSHAWGEAGSWSVSCTATDGEDQTVATLAVEVLDPTTNSAPDAPVLLSPWNGELLIDAVTLRIAPVADPDGAVPALEIRVEDAETDETVWAVDDVAQGLVETALAIPEPGEGSFRWRARAIDEDGLAGPWSPTWYFALAPPEEVPTGPYGCTCSGRGPQPGAPWGSAWLVLGLLVGRLRNSATNSGPLAGHQRSVSPLRVPDTRRAFAEPLLTHHRPRLHHRISDSTHSSAVEVREHARRLGALALEGRQELAEGGVRPAQERRQPGRVPDPVEGQRGDAGILEVAPHDLRVVSAAGQVGDEGIEGRQEVHALHRVVDHADGAASAQGLSQLDLHLHRGLTRGEGVDLGEGATAQRRREEPEEQVVQEAIEVLLEGLAVGEEHLVGPEELLEGPLLQPLPHEAGPQVGEALAQGPARALQPRPDQSQAGDHPEGVVEVRIAGDMEAPPVVREQAADQHTAGRQGLADHQAEALLGRGVPAEHQLPVALVDHEDPGADPREPAVGEGSERRAHEPLEQGVTGPVHPLEPIEVDEVGPARLVGRTVEPGASGPLELNTLVRGVGGPVEGLLQVTWRHGRELSRGDAAHLPDLPDHRQAHRALQRAPVDLDPLVLQALGDAPLELDGRPGVRLEHPDPATEEPLAQGAGPGHDGTSLWFSL